MYTAFEATGMNIHVGCGQDTLNDARHSIEEDTPTLGGRTAAAVERSTHSRHITPLLTLTGETERGIMRLHATALLLILLAGQVHAINKNDTTTMSVQDVINAVDSAFDKIGDSISNFFNSNKFSCSYGTPRKYYRKTCAVSQTACLTANITIGGQTTFLFKDCVAENLCNSTDLLTATITNMTIFQKYSAQNLTVASSQCCKTSRCNNAPHSKPALSLALLFAPVLPLLMHSA